MPSELARYSRQILFPGIGADGQARLQAAHALICGCGALGSAIADTLTRAGVGRLTIVDRDIVELSNLQRQVLFDEQDVADELPKAVAAVRKLRRINSQTNLTAVVADVDPHQALELVRGVDVILDGLDNFETRFLLNDVSLETGVPWIYGGCVGSSGQTMTIIPHRTACLRCLMESPPPPGVMPTCETAGVLGPAVNVVAALQATQALKLLAGRVEALSPVLLAIDLWDGSFRTLNVSRLRDESNCPACVQGRRDFLSGRSRAQAAVLCGRNAVQVSPAERAGLDLEALATRLAGVGRVHRNAFLLKLLLDDPPRELTIFPDGRALIQGTDDLAEARSLYARYVGM